MRAFFILIFTLLLSIATHAHAQGISQLQQFTSTTTPVSAITQTTWAKAIKLSGLNTAGATRCLNIASTGVLGIASGDCAGGSSFSYPFPNNATSTELRFNDGLISIAST